MFRLSRMVFGVAVVLLVVFCVLPVGAVARGGSLNTPPAGFTALFNGHNLAGWKGLVANPPKRAAMSAEELAEAQAEADANMREHWKCVDGVIEFDGHGDSLCTAKDYKNFEMYVDWKILPEGDSGVYIRGNPQAQIWDTTHEPLFKHGADKGSGSLWNNKEHENLPLIKADNPVGEWNTFYIRMIGDRVTVRLNDQLVVDDVVMENYFERGKPIPESGQIELQNHGNKLWFRNIYIRELPDDNAEARKQVNKEQRRVALFNGKNLDGLYTWIQGSGYEDPKQVFRVTDGMLHVTGEGYGGILTEQAYDNYHLVLEYKWGDRVWGDRSQKARDSGMLIHSNGADGGCAGRWMPAIEVQIIEGGVGDFILVSGKDTRGEPVPLSISCEVGKDRDGETIWRAGEPKQTFNLENRSRVNWLHRDPDWEDKLGFRGKEDADSPLGEWTRMDVISDGGHVTTYINGRIVNEAFDVTPRRGKLQLQTEMAELFVRRWELWPVGEGPEPAKAE